MEKMLGYLGQIEELLEQIHTITLNQMTVLLSLSNEQTQEEDSGLDMIAQMADYKDAYTQELSTVEDQFQVCYDKDKKDLSDKMNVQRMQEAVQTILKLKEVIMEQEEKNLLLMKSHAKKKLEKVHVPQNAKEVANAYKKQQKKSN